MVMEVVTVVKKVLMMVVVTIVLYNRILFKNVKG